ncbi:hypothetical protein JY651_42900 [Pyxidicoccus parkwayensis]|uniref:Uncharacterized protein n=1 Tax=Pyxidicoccus parkwayensis TaxID=2813578 RepID=A0ABX7NSS0_9BACT|nr:hypothetical protein [Pyxidicoccus parkwaysis]QSQ21830.1 hypothetical protein JY651_42900 [Pyxidicoccus parkwaysis]
MRPFRLAESRLAVPGVIGVRSPSSLSFGTTVHVLTGSDAGFPEAQPLAEWKSDVALVDARTLPTELRKQADIRLPEEERAEFEVYLWEMAELDAEFSPDTRELKALALDQLSRLTSLDAQTRHFLESHGQAYWQAGYTRHSDTLWVHRVGGDAPFKAWVNWHEAVREDETPKVPGWLSQETWVDLQRVRWADRVLRALSGGVVTEAALLLAHSYKGSRSLLDDDLTQAGIEAAERMASDADEVEIPLHGPARRVRLPGFTMKVWEVHPLDLKPGEIAPTHETHVPAEDAWVLVKNAG